VSWEPFDNLPNVKGKVQNVSENGKIKLWTFLKKQRGQGKKNIKQKGQDSTRGHSGASQSCQGEGGVGGCQFTPQCGGVKFVKEKGDLRKRTPLAKSPPNREGREIDEQT